MSENIRKIVTALDESFSPHLTTWRSCPKELAKKIKEKHLNLGDPEERK